jgi:hypothetical protein
MYVPMLGAAESWDYKRPVMQSVMVQVELLCGKLETVASNKALFSHLQFVSRLQGICAIPT